MPVSGNIGNRAGLGGLKQALEVYALRHRVIASNIANAEVDGYEPRRVEFEEILQKQVRAVYSEATVATNERHYPVGQASSSKLGRVVAEAPDPETGEARVDVEREMVSLVQNQLSYRMAVRLLDMKYNQLKSAITGNSR